MTNIFDYLNDGADWQAQAVLAYLKGHKGYILEGTWNSELGSYTSNLFVGRYENCREQGYIFSIVYKDRQKNYAVYEHRNSDQLCVVVFEKLSLNTPTLKDVIDVMKDKYDVTNSFSCGNIASCGDYIIDDIHEFIDSINNPQK